jgi:hypothetical protein
MWRPCAATLLLALAIAPRLSSADTPELRLLFVGDAAPFSSVGARGAAEGYVVTLCERIATALRPGRSPSWRETAIADGLDLLARDEADLLCGPVSDTVTREQHVDFSSPIAIGGIGAVLRPDAPPWLLRLLRIGEADPVPPRALLAKLDWPRRIAVLRRGTAAAWLDAVLARPRGCGDGTSRRLRRSTASPITGAHSRSPGCRCRCVCCWSGSASISAGRCRTSWAASRSPRWVRTGRRSSTPSRSGRASSITARSRRMGGVDVYLSVDHRVIDGGPAARAIRALEATLNGPVLDELRALADAS